MMGPLMLNPMKVFLWHIQIQRGSIKRSLTDDVRLTFSKKKLEPKFVLMGVPQRSEGLSGKEGSLSHPDIHKPMVKVRLVICLYKSRILFL